MYKVFIQDYELRLVSSTSPRASKKGVLKYDDRLPDWPVLKKLLFARPDQRLTIACKDKQACWRNFKKRFKLIIAAGGLVQNEEGQYLMMRRLGKWDLPKGKLDKGEDMVDCAIREVEEECGVSGLGITGKLVITYHVMRRNNEKCLKVSHWYRMTTRYSGKLVPQAEEGIDDVRWVDVSKIPAYAKDSWPSIKEVLKKGGIHDRVKL